MGKRILSGWLFLVVLVGFLVLTYSPISAAEFTATLNDHEGDNVKTSTITLKGSFYRMDLE